jgi:hypothetical protein
MDGCDLFDRCTTAALPLPPAPSVAVAPADEGAPATQRPPTAPPPAAPGAPAAYERRAGNDDDDVAAPSDDPLLPMLDA